MIRGLERMTAPFERINGPSLCVDALLQTAGADSIASLVSALPSLHCDDDISPLQIAPLDGEEDLEESEIMATPRVGLSLKMYVDNHHRPLDFIMQRYALLMDIAFLQTWKCCAFS